MVVALDATRVLIVYNSASTVGRSRRSTSLSQSSPLDATLTTAHQVTLTGLTLQTTYQLQAQSKNATQPAVNSQTLTFTTSVQTDFTGDGRADVSDLLLATAGVQKYDGRYDVAAPSGSIDIFDLVTIAKYFN